MRRRGRNAGKILDQFFDRLPKPSPDQMETARSRILDRILWEASDASMDAAPDIEPVRAGWKLGRHLLLVTAAIVIGVLIPAAIFRNFALHRTTRAIVETGEGSLLSGGQARPLQPGQRIEYGDILRSSSGAGAVIALIDGSQVEMRTESEISLKPAADGVQIHLSSGSVIVSAAKQGTRHLYVQTRDCTVSVVGTIFLVTANEVGSRVAVIQGEVHVRRGATLQALLPGEQIATASSMEAIPVVEEISWSRDAAAHLLLLRKSTAIPVGELEGSGAIADLPASTEKAIPANPTVVRRDKTVASPPHAQPEEATAALPPLPPIEDAYTATKIRALTEKAKGDLKSAIADFSKAIELRPGDAEAYNNRALAEYAKGDWKGAIADFNKAIELRPDYAAAYDNRAGAEYARGDFYSSRKDEAKANGLKNELTARPHASSSAPAGTDEPLPSDISLATCPTSQPTFARGEIYRAYSGCPLPRDQVGFLNLKGTRAMYVDGISAYNVPLQGKEKSEYYVDNSDSLELAAGRHAVRFVQFQLAKGKTLEDHLSPAIYVDQDIEVESGKTYTALWRTQATGRTMTIAPGVTIAANGHWVEVNEFKNNPASYFQLYDADVKNGDSAGALSALETSLALFPKDPNHKTVEELAKKLRASLNKAQLDAYRAANGGPRGPADKPTQTTAPKILGCATEQSGKLQLQEKVATPLKSEGTPNRQAPLDLKMVLSRATRYVEEYEAQLGNLIGEEVYVQNQARERNDIRSNRQTTMMPFVSEQHRRTESDFAILQVGQDWVGVREVHCLDGVPVQHTAADFQKILGDSPAAILKALDNISRESARYNIGVVQRTANLPTFALAILRSANAPRFEFKKTGETTIGGIRTWAVSFRELQGPTLVHDVEFHNEFSNGTLWIEPETGQILRTEMNVSKHGGQLATGQEAGFRGKIVVSYKNNPKLEMLVPVSMVEHYDTNGMGDLDCRADYFNFHRFQVDTHFNFGPLVPPDDGPPAPAPDAPGSSPPSPIPAAPVRPASPSP